MNRSLVIGISEGKQTCIGCGLSESEAMTLASSATGYQYFEVIINPTPYAVFTSKPEKAPAKKASKKAAKKKKA